MADSGDFNPEWAAGGQCAHSNDGEGPNVDAGGGAAGRTRGRDGDPDVNDHPSHVAKRQ
ncbi:hypothetical protein LZY01_12660 [Levilactobacillus zymae]|uniref:Uncharacterized protein n=1 Tax=Levilactobacillus zymae TaxID=267363 RepID=A0ABQ0WX31_9LACO|nr:hypothetical protein LZY01_12660 [Levilactobacillus zymae]